MRVVTINEVKKIFEDLINEQITRKDAERWAAKCRDYDDIGELGYNPKSKEDVIWDSIMYLSGVDLQIERGEYLFDMLDIIDEYSKTLKELDEE